MLCKRNKFTKCFVTVKAKTKTLYSNKQYLKQPAKKKLPD